MAQHRLTRDNGPQQIIDVDAEDASHIVEDARAEEEEISSAFGENDNDPGMYFQVRKYVKDSKEKAFCMEGTVADLPILPRIQRDFGEGKYEVWIFKNKKIYRRIQVPVIAPKVAPDPVPGGDPNFSRLIQLLEKRTETPPQPPATRWTPTDIIAAVAAAGTLLGSLKSVMAPAPATSMKETLDLLLVAKAAFSDGKEGGEEEGGLIGLAGKLISNPGFGDALKALTSGQTPIQQQPGAPRQLPAPGQPQQQILSAPPPAPPNAEEQQAQEFGFALNLMLKQAAKNADVSLYAEVIEDAFPDLIPIMTAPGALDNLAQFYPQVGVYRNWFAQLIAELASPAEPAQHTPEISSGNAYSVSIKPASAADAGAHPGGHSGHSGDAAGDDAENQSG